MNNDGSNKNRDGNDTGDFSYLKENIEEIRRRIDNAAARSGRRACDISIIAVSKTVEADIIIRAIGLGVRDMGENKVQELCGKYGIIGNRCRWHMIGHLQTNKVKYIIDKVDLIHSLDRIELAREIQKRAEKAGKIVKALVQVNISEEESKSGIPKEMTLPFLRELSGFRNLKIKGLMTIAPYAENPEKVRHVFRDLRKLLIDMRKENIDNIDMDCLSMGMSNDFEIAIEEGANMVRIGTAIFGPRHYV